MKQPDFHAGKLIVVTTPVHPLLLKQQRRDEHIYMMQTEHSPWKILPQDYLHRLRGQSFSGTTPPVTIPQQCSLPHRLGLEWRGRS